MTKPEQKHTPTPWDAEGATIYGDDLWVAVCQSSAGSVQEEINAAFIVLACNAHDDLVAALRRIEAWDLPATEEGQGDYETEYGSNGAKAFIRAIARHALDKVTG